MKKAKIIFNLKLLIALLIFITALLIFNVNVYATDTNSFALDEENIDVALNGFKSIIGIGGTGLITWKSSDESVATVEDGIVKGHKIGNATITATRGEEKDTCTVNVVYKSITIGGPYDESISTLNLILNEHDTTSLNATVKDDKYENVEDASVIWTSSDSSIVTVEQNGTIKGLKAGKATITASAAGVSDTCEVTVYNGPVFTDFSNAKYELLFDYNTDLKISNIVPADEKNNWYYYAITTSKDTKPTISITPYGGVDTEESKLEYLSTNTEEKYIFTRDIDKYVELNQDLYLWVVQQTKLNEGYYEGENYILNSTRFVVEGQKLTRPELPQLNLILRSFYIGSWNDVEDGENKSTRFNFNFPSATENRKFTVKIGKVTDKAILKKIQDNDYSGMTELQKYAKNDKGIYTEDLTTTEENYYISDETLFDGNKLLEHKEYYYIYVVFDDDEEKYYPIEGITLGQAWLSDISDNWDLWAYTENDFEWNDLSSGNDEKKDETVADKEYDKAGVETIVTAILVVLGTVFIIVSNKVKKYRDIV